MFGISQEFIDQFNLIAKQVAEIHAVVCKPQPEPDPAPGAPTGYVPGQKTTS